MEPKKYVQRNEKANLITNALEFVRSARAMGFSTRTNVKREKLREEWQAFQYLREIRCIQTGSKNVKRQS